MTIPPIDRLLPLLEKVTKTSTGWRACCSGHDDENPSLDITIAEDGKLLLICRSAGCKPKVIMESVGLHASDLFPSDAKVTHRRTASRGKTNGKVAANVSARWTPAHHRLVNDPDALRHLWLTRGINEATVTLFNIGITGKPGHRYWTFPILDASGTIIAVKAHGADGQDKKSWWEPKGVNSKQLFPVFLEPSGPVWVCPGELKALAVASGSRAAIGITSGEGSASKPTDLPVGALELLRGRGAAIPGDDDDTGRAWANHISRQITKAGIEARIVNLDLDRAAGLKDIGDWLTRHLVEDQMEPEAVAATLDDIWRRAEPWRESDTNGQDGRRAYRHRIISQCMADVEATEINWLWPNHFAKGRLNLVVGYGGGGKSTFTLALAASLSRGATWPDGQPGTGDPQMTLILSCEDDVADTIRPRLDNAEADCQFIRHIRGTRRSEDGEDSYFNLGSDLAALRDHIIEHQAAMVIIDPLTGFIPGVDSHRDSDVRGILGPLAVAAEETGAAIVCIMHLSKNQSAKAANRVIGSVGFLNAARMAWLVAEDPQEPLRRLLLPLKHNICEKPDGMAFEIVDGAVRWFPEAVTLDADEALQTLNEDRTGQREAKDWLLGLLATGPMALQEIKRLADAECASWPCVKRAKLALKIVHARSGFGKGATFTWSLPNDE